MTFGLPIGSFVYLIFALIDDLSLAPVAGAKNANDARAVSESNGQYTVSDMPETEVPRLLGAVPHVLRDHAVRIGKAARVKVVVASFMQPTAVYRGPANAS